MITLYHAKMSRSVRILWLLEELGLPFQLEQRVLGELKRPEHVALHPLGKVPVLTDGDVAIFESGAIVQYLLESYGHGRLEPKHGTPERAPYLQWLHFAEATLMPPLGLIAQHTRIRPPETRIDAIVPDAIQGAKNALGVVERAIAGHTWLTREFSAADVMMGYAVALADLFQLVTNESPQLKSYLARCKERPAFRRALAQ